jgi:hypothetical protein
MPYIPHNPVFRAVMCDLLTATHCYGCGTARPVTLLGYVGQYCRKGCWDWKDTEERPIVSRARSKYHMAYYNSCSPTKFVWPMNGPTTNECIRTRPTVAIPGYNC